MVVRASIAAVLILMHIRQEHAEERIRQDAGDGGVREVAMNDERGEDAEEDVEA
jgi:hypothetical protein